MKLNLNVQLDFHISQDTFIEFQKKPEYVPGSGPLCEWVLQLCELFNKGEFKGFLVLFADKASRTLGEDGVQVLPKSTYWQCMGNELRLAVALCKLQCESAPSSAEFFSKLGEFAQAGASFLKNADVDTLSPQISMRFQA